MRQISSFLPLYQAHHRWKDGSRVSLELPLFPNYIFVQIARRERVRVLEVPGVLSIVGCGREPLAIPEAYIHSLREGIRLHRIEPHPYLAVGERVFVKRGPMAGTEGVLARRKSGFRVVLTLELIQQSVAVEVDAEDLEPARSSHGTPLAS